MKGTNNSVRKQPGKIRSRLLLPVLALFILASFRCGKIEFLENKTPNPGMTGSLQVKISMSSVRGDKSKTILPPANMEPSYYKITGSGPLGSRFEEETSGDAIEINSLVIGEWTVSVEAYNSGDFSVASGMSKVLVVAGKTTPCTVLVMPVDGYGKLALEVLWADGVVMNPSVEATLSRHNGTPADLHFTVSGGHALAEVETAVGYYTLNVRLYDKTGSSSKFYGGAVEVVRVVKDVTTNATVRIFAGGVEPQGAEPEDPAFPSPGSPSGSDAVSSSTNQSDKKRETSPKLNALSGAGFVKPPQINNYGTVNLGYEIDVPAGRAGMQPGVGLSYSSSSGDGLAGIGWNMSTGLSVISRTTSHGQLYYDMRDTFTFNGKRLVKVEGSDENENGTYRLEIESGFSRFELSDIETGGVWRVYDKSGTVTILGEDSTSRLYHPEDEDKTYTWQFTRSFDLNGNYMTALYDTSEFEDNHIIYIKEIRYTGNYLMNTPANQYVRFHLKKRDDFYVSKAPGFIMKMDKLLDYIEVGWDNPSGLNDTELWRYTMVYGNSEDSNRPLLKTIDSTRNSTSPEFIYQPAEHKFVWEKVNNASFNDYEENHEATKYFEGDFNGDGISDMVFFNPETGNWKAAEGWRGGGYLFKTYGNKFRGYDKPEDIQWFKGNVTGDYNGDGRSDIAFYLPKTREFWVAEHNGTNFDFKIYGRQYITDVDIFRCEWFTGDYDGNGLSDAVLFDEASGQWILMRNLGGRFQFTKFSMHFKNLFRNDYSPDMNLDSEFTADTSEYGRDRDKVHFLMGDYNGDGRTDISIYDSRSGQWWVGENYMVPSSKYKLPSDVGFEIKWRLYKIFTAPEQTLFGFDRFSGDFNGDGFSDFLLFDRKEGEWWIGETGNGTINFRIFSKTPEYKEITRWLQGDFNGDGRTDIGFYSKTDNNFWVGEATPDGFRYRIYNNLANGPNPDEVLRTPHPKDQIKITDGSGIAVNSDSSKTSLVNYKYDGNYNTGKGEKVFPGYFGPEPEILIYSRGTFDTNPGFYTRNAGDTGEELARVDGLDNFAPDDENVKILNNEQLIHYGPDNSYGIIYYTKDESSYSETIHRFNLVHRNNSGNFVDEPAAAFNQKAVNNFNINESIYFINNYNAADYYPNNYLLVLDDQRNTPDFVLFTGGSSAPERIAINDVSYENELLPGFFKNIRSKQKQYKFFSGDFTGSGNAQVLVTDLNSNKWYLGTITGESSREISFTSSYDTPAFVNTGYTGSYHVIEYDNYSEIIYAAVTDSRVRFHLLTISGSSYSWDISSQTYSSLDQGISFKGEYGKDHKPIVYAQDGAKTVTLGSGITPQLAAIGENLAVNINRNDLMVNVYKFRWIQGDYNGDGKTDVGIFHLKERYWYFANTTGTVPDMIQRVKNGIGGDYIMEYANSTSFDNTGADNVPDLPMNYKVCTKLTIDDGFGKRVSNKYEYQDGYAFSDFINGYKETDYFGFGRFKVIDATGSSTTSVYHNVPYSDFRMNRALAGAEKESWFVGSDLVEYSRTQYEYRLHKIVQSSGFKVPSFLVEPVKVRKYMKGKLVETRESNIVLTEGKYEMVSKTEAVTDHYDDGVHQPTTIVNYSHFDNDEDTNEMRMDYKLSMMGAVNQTLDISDEDVIDNAPDTHKTRTDYVYDDKGNLVSETLSYAGSGLDSVDNRVMTYEYDGFGNRTKEINASAEPNRISRKFYDSLLHQFVVEEQAVKEDGYLATKYGINYGRAFGNVEKITDPNLNSTYFEYDYLGRLEKQSADTIQGKSILSINSYDHGFPMSAKVVQYTSDSVSLDTPGGGIIETRLYVDGMGRNIHTVRSAMTEQGKRYTKSGLLIYDELGRVISKSQTSWADDDEIDEFRPNTQVKHPTLTTYDASGRVKKVVLPRAYDGEDETSISYKYNDPYEVVETHSVGRSKRTIKNGRGQVLYVEDFGTGDDDVEVRAKIGFIYDIAGNRVKKMDLIDSSSQLQVPSYEVPSGAFDTGYSDTSGLNKAYWKFDAFGQLKASYDPDLGTSSNVYNAFGELASTTDAKGDTTYMTYDMMGRLTLKTLPGDEGTVAYEYDHLTGCANTVGRLVAIDDSSQRKEFNYDMLGRIKSEVRDIKIQGSGTLAGVFETSFEYDLLDRTKAVFYPKDPVSGDSLTVSYKYNAMGVASIKSSNGSTAKDIVSSVDYNEFGQMATVAYGNNTETNYEYDIKGRLTRLLTTSDREGIVKKIQDVKYQFKIDNSIFTVENTPDIDTAGNYTSATRYVYQYDGLNRLIDATGHFESPLSALGSIDRKFHRGYTYAPNGNMMSKTMYGANDTVEDQWTYTYAGYNHAVTSISSNGGGFVMQYDAAGNMISKVDNQKSLEKEMVYDSYNRIRKVIDPVGDETIGRYFYDDQGFRVRKLAKREYSGEDRQVEVLYPSMYFGIERQRMPELPDGSLGQIIPNTEYAVNNVYLNGVRIAAVIPSGEARFYLTDQVDSVKVIVSDTGIPVSRMEYLPYGETWFQEGDENYAPKYNSQELDKESGFYFYNARHYDPEIGRFVTADSVVPDDLDTQAWNRFAYVRNNPIRYKDPTGHFWDDFVEGVKEQASSYVESAKNAYSKGKDVVTNPGKYAKAIKEKVVNKVKQYANDPKKLAKDYGNAILEPYKQLSGYNAANKIGKIVTSKNPAKEIGKIVVDTGVEVGLQLAAAGVVKGAGKAIKGLKNLGKAASQVDDVGYEVLSQQNISGASRSAHRASANKNLLNELEKNTKLRNQLNNKLGGDVVEHMRSGKSGLKNPPGTEWHHPVNNSNSMELLNKSTHRNPDLQNILHPLENRGGGMKANY